MDKKERNTSRNSTSHHLSTPSESLVKTSVARVFHAVVSEFCERVRLRRWGLMGIVLTVIGVLPSRAVADQIGYRIRFADVRSQPAQVMVYQSRSVLLHFDEALQRISISEPKIADVLVVPPSQVLINAKGIGTCTLVVWGEGDAERPGFLSITVSADVAPLIQQVKTLFPGERISIESLENRVILSGSVSSARVAEAVAQIFDGTGLKVVNLLRPAPTSTKQVLLEVRVAEVNKRALQELGANYSLRQGNIPFFIGHNTFATPFGTLLEGAANMSLSDLVNISLFRRTNSGGAFEGALIRALQSRNAIRTLAEPNIIALNGQKASFLAGGEFPYPVPQPSQGGVIITIAWREFGVRLNFTPTITEDDHIRLELEPEVSALDFSTGITLAGTRIPGLINRKAKTTLELDDGQSFALAGLLSNDVTRLSAPIPGLSFLPIIGYMFRSQRYINNETELVFICTARIVKPVTPDKLPPLPGQGAFAPSGLEGNFGHVVPAVRKEEKKK